MSTARGSEPRGGAQTPGEPGTFDPALDHLIGALTTAGHPHELAGRDTALAAFRAASQPRRRPARRATRRREFLPLLLPARLAALVAAGVTVTAGFTAAAYAQALPAPVQEIAHTVLAPIGVPDSKAQPSGSHAPSPTTPGTRGVSPSGSAANSPTQPGSSGVPGPSPSAAAAGYTLTLNVDRQQLPTGAFAKFTGTVTRHGRPAAGVTVRLLERARGMSGWQTAASHVTGRFGHVTFSVLPPTAAELYLLEADGARSAPITVTVKPPLTFWLVAGKVNDRLHVAAPFSKPGTTVDLMEQVKGAWTTIARSSLGTGRRAVFVLPVSTAAGHLYRAELPAHELTSDRIWIPVNHTGATAITTSPSPTGTPSPSPSSSPTATPSPTASPGPTSAPSPPGASGSPTTSGSPTASGSPSTSSTTASPSPPDSTTSPPSTPSPS